MVRSAGTPALLRFCNGVQLHPVALHGNQRYVYSLPFTGYIFGQIVSRTIQFDMETMKQKLQTCALLAGLAALLCGCSSVRPLTSTPPAPVITLKTPASIKHVLTTTVLPAGDYRATMEDKKGYYYQAPAKIIVYDLGSAMYDGGLYLQKGTRVPMRYYIISQDGQHGKGKFKTAPNFEFKPSVQTNETTKAPGGN